MRIVTAAAIAAGLLSTAVAAPTLAADEVINPKTCVVIIASREASGKRRCAAMTVRKDVPNARTDFIFRFDDGFQLELAGPMLSLSSDAYLTTPDRITWANPGQTTPRVEVHTAAAPTLRGRCVVRFHRGGQQLFGSLICSVSSQQLGRIDVELFTEKPPKPGK